MAVEIGRGSSKEERDMRRERKSQGTREKVTGQGESDGYGDSSGRWWWGEVSMG